MEKRNFILLASTLVLIPIWRLFDWLLPNEKVDWFLFYDMIQKPFWYVFYSSYYLSLIILSYVIYNLSKNTSRLKTLSLFLIIVNLLRLLVYWLFRGSISLDILIASVMIYSIIILSKWQR